YSLADSSTTAAEAVAYARAALVAQPESPVVYLNLANALRQQGLEKEPEAEAATRKAIALQPDYAVAYVHLAANQLKQKKLPQAEADSRVPVPSVPPRELLRRSPPASPARFEIPSFFLSDQSGEVKMRRQYRSRLFKSVPELPERRGLHGHGEEPIKSLAV